MKQILIVVCALSLIFSLHFVQASFLGKTKDILVSKVVNLEKSIEENRLDKIQERGKEIQDLWNKKEMWLGVLCNHDAIDEIRENISNIQRYILLYNEDDDIKLDILLECNILKERIEGVVDNEKLKLTNVL